MLVLGALLVLLALANMGVEITPLITGLGIGGVAVALAAQSILSDVFGSLTILFDKPSLVGDFIIVGDKMGTVEAIGVKTTRVRALSGEQLVFANSDLLSSRIQNYKRMAERRVVFGVTVSRGTPPELAERAAQILKKSVQAREKVRFDRAHLMKFGAYGLEYEVVYYVLSPDYNVYMDIQQAINLDTMRAFAAAGIEFAFSTQIEVRGSGEGGIPLEMKSAEVRSGE
jgi:small-conductance mechanosensitive channel